MVTGYMVKKNPHGLLVYILKNFRFLFITAHLPELMKKYELPWGKPQGIKYHARAHFIKILPQQAVGF